MMLGRPIFNGWSGWAIASPKVEGTLEVLVFLMSLIFNFYDTNFSFMYRIEDLLLEVSKLSLFIIFIVSGAKFNTRTRMDSIITYIIVIWTENYMPYQPIFK